MASYNLSADLAKNLAVYSDYIDSRAAVETPLKIDVPLVAGLYFDDTPPVGQKLEEHRQADYAPEPIGFAPAEFESAAAPVTYRSPVTGDLDLLGLVNDRLKTQARRYPHPITNEMEAIT